VALVNLLRSWGIFPSAVVGHSSGEIAAAYAAGAFSMETAVCAAYLRGFMAKAITRKGAMAAVGYGRREVTPYLGPETVLACENSGSSVTISGDADAIDLALIRIKNDNPDAFAKKLNIEHAYHSREYIYHITTGFLLVGL
jgi:acyl transferase domain-containing protein